jgi:hypothetical protein
LLPKQGIGIKTIGKEKQMMKTESSRFSVLSLAVVAMLVILNAPLPTSAGTAPLQFNGYYDGGRLVYDPNTDLTWYQPPYSSAGTNWDDALNWAANLNIGGVTGWQLPSVAPLTQADFDAGTNYSDEGQLGHLWYVDLGNQASDMTNPGPFDPTLFNGVSYGQATTVWTSGGPYYEHLSTFSAYFDLHAGEYGFAVVGFYNADEIAVVSGDIGPNGLLGPLLAITQSSNSVTVSWPSPSTGWTLQQCSDLAAGGWTASGLTVTNDGTNCSVTLSAPTGYLFFRLVKTD